jgi:hypothetical protein
LILNKNFSLSPPLAPHGTREREEALQWKRKKKGRRKEEKKIEEKTTTALVSLSLDQWSFFLQRRRLIDPKNI